MKTEYPKEVSIKGYLTKDPEVRLTKQGTPMAHLSIGRRRSYKLHDGTPKEEIDYVDVSAFGKKAEEIANNFHKGSQIAVQGHLKLNQWETEAGEKRSKLTITLEDFQYIAKETSKEKGIEFVEDPSKDTSSTRMQAVEPQHVSVAAKKSLQKHIEHDDYDEITY